MRKSGNMLSHEDILSIAQAIHEDYRNNNHGSDYDIPWEELPEDIKQVNREQANEFIGYIEYLNLSISYSGNSFGGIEQLTDEQIETIADRIHTVWMNSKITSGWVFGTVRDNKKKLHPLLIPYEQLSAEEKDKDRAIARSIVPLLHDTGLRVF